MTEKMISSNLQKALDGGMEYREAAELFESLTTMEAVELLKHDLEEGEEVYIAVEAGFTQMEFRDFRCFDVETYKASNAPCYVLSLDIDHGFYAGVSYVNCEVHPQIDYDTSDLAREDFSFDDSKVYYLDVVNKEGRKEGCITISF